MPSLEQLSAQLADAEARLAAQQQQIESLQAQISMYQLVLDTMPLTILWKDQQSTFLGCNRAQLQMAGVHTLADFIGKTDNDMPWGEGQADAFRADDREVMLADRPKLRIIEPITSADGATLWLETNKLPLHDASGTLIGILVTIEDITDRRADEEQRAQAQQTVIDQQAAIMREREELLASLQRRDSDLQLYKAIIEQSPDGVIVTGSDGTLIYANPSFETITGLQVGADASFATLFPADFQALMLSEATNVRDRGRWQGRLAMSRPDGTRWVAQINMFVLYDPADQTPRWVGVFRDISADEHAAESLRASEAQLRSLTEALPVVMAVIDTEGRYRVSTGSGLSKLGLKPGQLVGVLAFDMYDKYPELVADLRRALAGETFTAQRAVNELILETIHTPIRNEQGDIDSVILVSSDVTERLRAEQESLLLQEQVIAAQQAALRELSTPLIPVADDVVVMPLIGSIDSARAQQVIESLLQGVADTRAVTAIIDITGVPVVDTQVANALLRAAQAVRLLGVQVVLTGIRPEVAQTLVGLGADLSGITTRGTLQVAITEALNLQSRRGPGVYRLR